MKRKSKKSEPHLSIRALARETGLDRETVQRRLAWGCGEGSEDTQGRVTLTAFIHDLDLAEAIKVARNRERMGKL